MKRYSSTLNTEKINSNSLLAPLSLSNLKFNRTRICIDIPKNYVSPEKQNVHLGEGSKVFYETHKSRCAMGTVDTVKYASQT